MSVQLNSIRNMSSSIPFYLHRKTRTTIGWLYSRRRRQERDPQLRKVGSGLADYCHSSRVTAAGQRAPPPPPSGPVVTPHNGSHVRFVICHLTCTVGVSFHQSEIQLSILHDIVQFKFEGTRPSKTAFWSLFSKLSTAYSRRLHASTYQQYTW